MKKKKGWESAILEVLDNHKGVATIKQFYNEVPRLINNSQARDFDHNIRGYLTRLKKKNLIKQTGISTYALKKIEIKNSIYERIQKKDIDIEKFLSIPKNKIHNHIEGMLIEIGNMMGFDTYTPDKNVIFNGKKLLELTDYQKIPYFTYLERIKKIETIDVIWFKEGYPIKTFDVENSTDFTKALVRCYQLKYFRTKCFLISQQEKERTFKDRINTSPFSDIEKNVKFKDMLSVFKDYESILKFNQHRENSDLL